MKERDEEGSLIRSQLREGKTVSRKANMKTAGHFAHDMDNKFKLIWSRNVMTMQLPLNPVLVKYEAFFKKRRPLKVAAMHANDPLSTHGVDCQWEP